MKIEMQQYFDGPRDIVIENALAQSIRRLPHGERYQLVLQAIDTDVSVGLSFARQSLTRNEDFRRLLMLGLENAKDVSIRAWLSCLWGTQGLGPMKKTAFFDTLFKLLPTHLESVENLLHYLPEVLGSASTYGSTAYVSLVTETYNGAQRQGNVTEWLMSVAHNPMEYFAQHRR